MEKLNPVVLTPRGAFDLREVFKIEPTNYAMPISFDPIKSEMKFAIIVSFKDASALTLDHFNTIVERREFYDNLVEQWKSLQ